MHLKREFEQQLEEAWALRREAVRLLDLVVAEWESDPRSVQCFDLRTVARASAVVKRLRELQRALGDAF